ncbi:MAG: maleylacetoacetate isomerase [Hellea sp.]|nr:maleylacetoacetate isomerase [Hellea sp.]
MSSLKLHNYFRSSTSVRVRIALNLKGLEYEYIPYALLPDEHKSETFMKLNPQGLVPALEIENTTVLTQSMAIIEYLEDAYPEPSIMPPDALGKARVRSLAQIIGCDVHPVNNLRILRFIESEFGADKEAKKSWFTRWAEEGFTALETRLASEPETADFCHGNAPSLADICLYAQVLNNRRFEVKSDPYPTIMRIFTACNALPSFQDARPEFQTDAE